MLDRPDNYHQMSDEEFDSYLAESNLSAEQAEQLWLRERASHNRPYFVQKLAQRAGVEAASSNEENAQ